MMTTIMVSIFIAICGFFMWFPGFLMAYNMCIAMSGEKPSVGTVICALIPGINLGVARKQLYGTAKLVWGILIALVVTALIKIGLYYFVDSPIGILLSLIFTFVFFGMIVLYWAIQGYVLLNICNMIQEGFLTKVLCFLMPPLASYLIGRDCIPRVRASVAEIENADLVYED